MSSGDSTVVPLMPTSDTNKVAPSNQTEINEQHSTASTPDQKVTLAASTSDVDLQEQSMAPSVVSTSESLENVMTPGLREVTSLDGLDTSSFDEDVGEMLKRDDERSAFKITSVRPANTDDLEKGGIRQPVSTDSLSLHVLPEKGESGGSEDSMITNSDKQQRLNDTQQSSLLQTQSKPKFIVGGGDSTAQLEIVSEVLQAGVTSSPKMMSVADEAASKSSHPPGGLGMAAPPGNGSSVLPNRFRRVNQYERGRWTVRDSLVTEEQEENLPPRKPPLQNAKSVDSNEGSSDTSPKQQRVGPGPGPGPVPTSVVEPSLLQVLPNEFGALSGVVGGGLAPADSTSDKDSSSVHMDRSSTAAETLSRNTSMSSIVLLAEKSADGDDMLGDIETEVTGIIQNSMGHEQEVNDVPLSSPHPPVMPTSSSGASTAMPQDPQDEREEQLNTPAGSAPVLE